MLGALYDGPRPLWPNRPLGAAAARPPEADAPQKVAAEYVAVLPQPERRYGYVVLHRGIFANVGRQW